MAELRLEPVDELRSFYSEDGVGHTPPYKAAWQGYKGYPSRSIKTWKSGGAYKIIGRIIFDKNKLKTLQNTKITKITILYTATNPPTNARTSSRYDRKIQLNEYNSSNQNFNYDSCGDCIGFFNGSYKDPGEEKTYELSENSTTEDDQNLFQGLVSYLQKPDTQGIILGTDAVFFRDGLTDDFPSRYNITLDENFISLTSFILKVEYSEGISSDISNLIIGKEQISPSLITFNIKSVEGANTYKIGFNNNIEIGQVTVDTNIPQDVYTFQWDVATKKNEILQSLSSTTEGSIEIYCHPYNGSDSVGNNSIFTLNVTIDNNIVPNIGNIESTEGVSNISELSLDHFVQGKSLIKISAPISPGEGASITSCELSLFDSLFEGAQDQGSNKYIWSIKLSNDAYKELYGTFSYLITVTDSRNRTATKSGNIIIDRYLPPQIINFKAIQVDNNGASSLIGNYVSFQVGTSVTSLLSQNSTGQTIENNKIIINITGKRKGSSSSHTYEENDVINDISINKTYAAKEIQEETETGKDNEFIITITDIIDNSTQVSELGQQTAILDFVGDNSGKVGVAIGANATTGDIGYIKLGWPLKIDDATVRQKTVEALQISQSQSTLPFKIAFGQTTVTGTGWTTVDLRSLLNQQGAAPIIVVSYAGDADCNNITPLKTKEETAASFKVSMCGTGGGSTVRSVNWIAIQALSSS